VPALALALTDSGTGTGGVRGRVCIDGVGGDVRERTQQRGHCVERERAEK
jgi:hypothetical protein